MIGHLSNLCKKSLANTPHRLIAQSKLFASRPTFISPMSAPRSFSSAITRIGIENPNMSQAVVHNGIVYISGQVDDVGSDTKSQTSNILAKIDSLLEQAGTDKSKLLTASIWLKDMSKDFQDMNGIWNTWLDSENKPVRAAVEANMASPKYLVEIQVSAAL